MIIILSKDDKTNIDYNHIIGWTKRKLKVNQLMIKRVKVFDPLISKYKKHFYLLRVNEVFGKFAYVEILK